MSCKVQSTKWFLGLILGLLVSTTAMASAYYTVTGYGHAFGGCYGNPSWNSCVHNIEWQAENDSKWQAQNQCSSMRGTLMSPFPTSCFDNCNPMYMPSPGQYTSVSCNADCNYTCIVN